jgi:hypothetical protein
MIIPPPNGSSAQTPAAPSELRAYWNGLRGDAAFPPRHLLDPRGIAGVLDQTFLIERIAPGAARFRLAGMQLNTRMGMELRDMPISALIAPPARKRFSLALIQLFSLPAILDIRLQAESSLCRPSYAARMLVLPLGDLDGKPSLGLGCLVFENQHQGYGPRRFAITGLICEPVLHPNLRFEHDITIKSNVAATMREGTGATPDAITAMAAHRN